MNFKLKPLTSDVPGTAPITDANLVNPWGLVIQDSTAYIAANGSNLILTYNLKGATTAPPINSPEAPTGLVLNTTTGFLITAFSRTAPSTLIVVTESGVLAGYNPAVDSNNFLTIVTTPNAVYKGAVLSKDGFLYVSNFFTGMIEKYNTSWILVSQFTDPALLAANYAPFGLTWKKNKLIASFALRDGSNHDDVAGAGNGYVDSFSNGIPERLISRGSLNAPWGLAAKDKVLLVGNFGDGVTNLFCLQGGKLVGPLKDKCCNTIVIDGLWAVVAASRRDSHKKKHCTKEKRIYVTAGSGGEAHGLFAVLVEGK